MAERRPIIRHGTSVSDDGVISHDDRPLPWEEADRIAGRRLDRRRSWAVINGQICSLIRWTEQCTGCSDGHAPVGSGCHECGYTGRRRHGYWMPINGEPADG